MPYISTGYGCPLGLRWVLLAYFRLWRLHFSYSKWAVKSAINRVCEKMPWSVIVRPIYSVHLQTIKKITIYLLKSTDWKLGYLPFHTVVFYGLYCFKRKGRNQSIKHLSGTLTRYPYLVYGGRDVASLHPPRESGQLSDMFPNIIMKHREKPVSQ